MLFQRLALMLTSPWFQFGLDQPQSEEVIATPAPNASPLASAVPTT